MISITRTTLLAVIIGLAAAVGSPTLHADDAPAKATGTIVGRVLNEKGEPAKGVRVGAFAPGALSDRKPAGGKAAAATPPAAGKLRSEVLAKATTGDDGTYTLTDVPVGKVRIIAGAKGSGFGFTRELVVVKPNETTKAPEINLRTASNRPTRPNAPKP